MSIDWLTLGIWFFAAIGFFAVCLVCTWITAWGSSGTLVDLVITYTAVWIFATGLVRSVSEWNVALCWLVGLVLIFPLLAIAWFPAVLFMSLFYFLSEMRERWGHKQN